ncbi:MAG TPA: VOC family protein [Gemmatimonadaceae bacterium]|nr:VOC family protein [Gemmatimonadaceae bacterium]
MPATTPTLALTQIGQILIPVTDLARATAFYRDTLGMRFLFEVPQRMAFFDCGGIRLMLGMPEPNAEPVGAGMLYYKVDDIQSASQALVERGVVVINGPQLIARMSDHDLWLGEFRDSEGNPFALMSEVRR